jgi:hypothetical protein
VSFKDKANVPSDCPVPPAVTVITTLFAPEAGFGRVNIKHPSPFLSIVKELVIETPA